MLTVRSVPSPTIRTELPAVEARLELAHPLLLGVPVEEAGVEDEVRVLLERHLGLLRRAAPVGYSTTAQRTSSAARALAGRRHRLLEQPAALVVELGARVHVLGGADRQPCLLVLDRVALDRRQLAEQLERRRERPVEVDPETVGAPVDAREVVGAPAAELAGDLLHERPRERVRAHRDLPAGLHLQTSADHELGELEDAWVGHGGGSYWTRAGERCGRVRFTRWTRSCSRSPRPRCSGR